MPLDLERVRAETPGLQGPEAAARLFLNSAGASLQPAPVIATMNAYLAREVEVGGYEAEAEQADLLQDFYAAFAALFRVDASEIAYCENATRAWDMVAYGVPFAPGDRILTAEVEYVSNALAYLQLKQRFGVEIDIAPADAAGAVDVEAMRRLIRPETKLISLPHMPTQGGLVNPAAEIGALAREYGVLYLLDICQSVGQLDLDLRAIGCDFATGTGRKFLRGPRGTGFLYARREALARVEPPFIDLLAASWVAEDRYEWRDDARKFENFEQNYAGKAALGRAVRYMLEIGPSEIETRTRALAADLRARLGAIPGVSITDRGTDLGGIVTFVKADEPTSRLSARLKAAGVAHTVSPPGFSRWDVGRRGFDEGLLRVSPHYFNADVEIERFAALVAAA